jgi:hypothetical protein
MWCHYSNKNKHEKADFRESVKFELQKNSLFEAKAGPGKKSFVFLCLFKEMLHSKGG